MPTLAHVLDSLDQLPSLPSTIVELLQVINDPKKGLSDLEQIVRRDLALTGRVLRTVNSAYYAVRHKVSDIPTAINLLGFNVVKSLALSLAIFAFLERDLQGLFEPGRLWNHSLRTAQISQKIAKHLPLLASDPVYVSSLLHDTGKLVFARFLPKDYRLALVMAQTDQLSEVEAERRIFGLSHPEIATKLFQRWLFPEDLCLPIQFHHEPEKALSLKQEVAVTAVANALANEAEPTLPGLVHSILSEQVWETLGLTRDQALQIAREPSEVEGRIYTKDH